ncbi:MAG: hypothetical protein GX421_02400 [Caldisericales bacterium]|nr:hypothetical protein [Caldisericales bacterium]
MNGGKPNESLSSSILSMNLVCAKNSNTIKIIRKSIKIQSTGLYKNKEILVKISILKKTLTNNIIIKRAKLNST